MVCGVVYKEGEALAKAHDCALFMETSAKGAINVRDLFVAVGMRFSAGCCVFADPVSTAKLMRPKLYPPVPPPVDLQDIKHAASLCW